MTLNLYFGLLSERVMRSVKWSSVFCHRKNAVRKHIVFDIKYIQSWKFNGKKCNYLCVLNRIVAVFMRWYKNCLKTFEDLCCQWDDSQCDVKYTWIFIFTWRVFMTSKLETPSISGCFGACVSFLAHSTPSLKRCSQMACRFFLGINILQKFRHVNTSIFII